MFNEEFKQSYIDEVQNNLNATTIKQLVVYFNICAEYERELQKDISCFTLNEILGYYKNIGTPSLSYLQSINCQLVKYVDWCCNNQMVPGNQNNFSQINTDMLEQCVNVNLRTAKFTTRENLLSIINRCQYLPADNFLLLALFEGICGVGFEEIRYLYPTDFVDNTVKLHTGRELEVSNKLVDLAKESAETFYYETADGKQRKYNLDDKRCFKAPGILGQEDRERFYITQHLVRMKEDYLFITKKSLMESGRIDMIRKYMAKSKLSAIECIRKFPEIQERYGMIQSIPRFCDAYKDMLNTK